MAYKRKRSYRKKRRSSKRRKYSKRRIGYRKRARMSRKMSSGQILGSIRAGGVVVRHSEYITDIISPGQSGFFASKPFVLNGGNSDTLPWGNAIAQCFEQYKFRRMIFEFRTLCTEVATGQNPAMGAIIMGTKYDAIEPNFKSKQEMENYEYTSSCKPSCTMYHTINTKAITGGKLFVRDFNAQSAVDNDRRFYDLGNFTIATANLQAQNGVALGELWVHYEMVLYKPILIPEVQTDIDWFQQAATANQTLVFKLGGTATVDGQLVIPRSPWANLGGTIGTVALPTGDNTVPLPGRCYTAPGTAAGVAAIRNHYLFPPNLTSGKFLVTFHVAGTAITASGNTNMGITGFTTVPSGPIAGATHTSYFAPVIVPYGPTGNATHVPGYTQTVANQTNMIQNFIIELKGPGAGFFFDTTSVIPTAVIGSSLAIIGIPSNMFVTE